MTVEERFWDKVDMGLPLNGSTPARCWLWTGAKNRDGYGNFGLTSKKTMLSHRVSWMFQNGPIPVGMNVLHRCDNPDCVNPFHLFLGTQKDNVDDCASKGRRNQVRYTKLDPEQRDEIKRLYATGEWTFAALGRKFGVTYQSIRWHVT